MTEEEVREAFSRFQERANFTPFAKLYMLLMAKCDADIALLRLLYPDNPEHAPLRQCLEHVTVWLGSSDLALSEELGRFFIIEYGLRLSKKFTLLSLREQLEPPVFE